MGPLIHACCMSSRLPWKEEIKDVLNIHQSERRGLIVLMVLFLLLAGWAVYEQWLRPPDRANMAVLEQRVQQWIDARADTSVAVAELDPFPFDPNLLERQEWLALGLSERQVDGIERYRNKGGQFRTKRDLSRMYSVPPDLFARLEPFILLPDSLPKRTRERKGRKDNWESTPRPTFVERTPERSERQAREPRNVEVNSADSAALVALPGIGPAFAKGILRYRDRLGGYHTMEQLAEVYVLKDKPDALERLKTLLVVDSLMVRKLPINTCTVEELAAHPYAGWKVAKPLIAYRKQHGPFSSVRDITGCQAVGEEVFRKLAPYLTVE